MKKTIDNHTRGEYYAVTMAKQKFIRKRLTEAREANGWGYTDLVFKLFEQHGIRLAYNTIVNWEDGRSQPRVDQLLALADTLGKPMGYFFAHKTHHSEGVVVGDGKHAARAN